jgi:hypothetical protein
MPTSRSHWFGPACLTLLLGCARLTPVAPTLTHAAPSTLAITPTLPLTPASAPPDATDIAAAGYSVCPYSESNRPGQIGIFGIFPGLTTRNELFALHGEPDSMAEIYDNGQIGAEWTCSALIGAKVIVRAGSVVRVFSRPSANEAISVESILLNFGCPD